MFLKEKVSLKNILNLLILGIVKINLKNDHAFLFQISHFILLIIRIYHIWVYSLLIKQIEETEQNP